MVKSKTPKVRGCHGPWLGPRGPLPSLYLVMVMALFLLASISCGGGGLGEEAIRRGAAETIRRFLEACGERRADEVRHLLSRSYLEENRVPDPLGEDELEAALGRLEHYRFDPAEMRVEGSRAVAPVYLGLRGEEVEREEVVSLDWDGSRWLVDSFTAMDWRRKRPSPEKAIALAEAQSALRAFLADCLDHRTDKIFTALSSSFRERYRLGRPWTREEFSGIFGTARSYRFHPERMTYADGTVDVDVTIEFGSPGNLEEQTSRVRLVQEQGTWKVDSFPFFLL